MKEVTRKIKIIHVAASARTFIRFRLPILLKQIEDGAIVEVACRPDQPYADQIMKEGIIIRNIDMPDTGDVKITDMFKAIKQLRKILKSNHYDILHAHQPMGGLIGMFAGKWSPVAKLFYTTGGLKSHDGMGTFKRGATQFFERLKFSMADAVFSVNQEDIETMKEEKLVHPSKVHFVGPKGGCGIDTDKFFPFESAKSKIIERADLGIPHTTESVLVGTVGRIVWEKGYRELIEAFKIIKETNSNTNIKCIIIGDGPNKKDVAQLIKDYELDDVVFLLGRKSNVPDYLRVLDIFVLASHREGMPTVVLEAMASALPVIATNIRGSREAISHGENGLLINVNDPLSLSKELLILAEDSEKRIEFAESAKKEIDEKYAADILLPKHIELLDQKFIKPLLYEKLKVKVNRNE